MKKKSLLIVIVAVIIIAAIFIVAYKAKSKTESNNVIRIGVLSFLTGTYAQMGNDLANGVLLAYEEYRDKKSEDDVNVEIRIEDGKGEGKTAASAFARLQQWGLDAAIVAGDNQVPTIASVIVRDRIPTIATIMSNSKALEYNSEEVWIFRDWISVTSLAETMANYAVDNLNLSTIAILKMRSEFGDEAEKAFTSTFSEKGGETVLVESFNEMDSNVKSVVLKTIAANANAIYVAGYGVCYGIVINQLRECGFKGSILTVDAVMNPETKAQIKDFNNIYFARFVEPTDSEYELFKQNYQKRFGEEASVYSAYGYDSFNILISGFKGKDLSAINIRDEIMRHGPYNTLLGIVRFKPNGDCAIPLTVQQTDNSQSIGDM